MYNKANDDDDHAFAHFLFCNVGGHHELDIIRMLLVYKQSIFGLFFNKNLVTILYSTDYSMTVKVNYVTIKTTRKSNVKGYG